MASNARTLLSPYVDGIIEKGNTTLSVSGLLNRKLTREERAELLEELYGFSLVNDAEPNQKPHDIIYDDDGMEFYGKDENCQFNLETLADFFKYSRYLAESAGVRKSQWEIKKALGLA